MKALALTFALLLVLLAVSASDWTTSAKASWIDRYDTPNSGYCETAPPGGPLGLYLCPENPKRTTNALRQKPKRNSKPKSGRDALRVDRSP
jgi:hypothetical protein